MKISSSTASAVLLCSLVALASQAQAQSFSEGFDGTGLPADWVAVNLSTAANTGTGLWRVIPGISDGVDTVVFPNEGASFAAVSYTSSNSSSTNATLSNWLLTPQINGLKNGDTFSFFTTTTPESAYADRLLVRLSTAGSSTNVGATTTSVGDFTTVLLDINPTLSVPGYPEDWTRYTLTVSGLAGPVSGRLAFHYFVTQGGPSGANSNIIGLDSFSYTAAAVVPEPASWALLLGGAAGLLALQRRRRAQD